MLRRMNTSVPIDTPTQSPAPAAALLSIDQLLSELATSGLSTAASPPRDPYSSLHVINQVQLNRSNPLT